MGSRDEPAAWQRFEQPSGLSAMGRRGWGRSRGDGQRLARARAGSWAHARRSGLHLPVAA